MMQLTALILLACAATATYAQHKPGELAGGAYAKAKPGALSYGTPGIGSVIHLSTELFNFTAGGLRRVHVPYKGNSFAIIDLIAGRIEMLLAAAGVAPHIKSGKLRARCPPCSRRYSGPQAPRSEAGSAGCDRGRRCLGIVR
jgi:tripartite-type tricarboxylate transporter receptor subunit TctC